MGFSTLGRIPNFVRWLGVDFFNTLYGTSLIDGPKTAWTVLHDHGIYIDIEKIWRPYRALEIEDFLGHIDTNERYARWLAALGLFSNTDPARNRKLVLALRAAEKRDLTDGYGVLMGAVEFLEWAKSRGIALILVSNVTEVGREVQQESGLMGFFKTFATSRDLGAVKGPEGAEANLFEAFSAEFDLDPTLGLIVDDEERWLKVAHEAGFCTALLKQAWTASRDLQPPFMPRIIEVDFPALQRKLEALM